MKKLIPILLLVILTSCGDYTMRLGNKGIRESRKVSVHSQRGLKYLHKGDVKGAEKELNLALKHREKAEGYLQKMADRIAKEEKE